MIKIKNLTKIYNKGQENQLIKNLSDSKMAQIRNKKLGIIMQEYALVNDMTPFENVMLPLDFILKK